MNNLCYGCFIEKDSATECPECGWQDNLQPESPLYLKLGTILNKRYLLGKVLGHGGFGITYLAWDNTLNIKLAIKEYFPHDFAARAPEHSTISIFSGEAGKHFKYGLDKFLEEARAIAKFQEHANIVSVNDYFKENNTAYMVMSYYAGLTFKQYLEEKGNRISYDLALNIIIPVMDALREIHRTGLLHRDISPDNIYITRNKQVKLLDFGSARHAIGEHSQSLSVILKPGYAPEEQYRRRGKQGPWTDIYAVASTLYRAITGQVPPESLDRLEHDDIQAPSALGIDITEEAEAALMQALSVRAQDRFDSIEEFQNRFFLWRINSL